MADDFRLTKAQLADIALDLKKKIEIGLKEENSQIKCLPVFISPIDKITSGASYVLDLGGSNLRAALVSFKDGEFGFVKTPIKRAMPWKRNIVFPKEEFLKIQADLLSYLDYPEECPLGYCFSYPAKSLMNRDARLINWTKGIMVSDTIGENVGTMLGDYIKEHNKDVKISKISVINDTIASLFAGYDKSSADVYIGLVVGTGSNMATFINSEDIPKLNKTARWKGITPVNLESGNFNPPHLTKWDDEVDEKTLDKKLQLLEKAVSGAYLGQIFKAIFPKSTFNPDSGAKGLIKILSNPERISHKELSAASQIYERSSKLIAASLAGLILFLKEHQTVNSVSISAEGSLFWSSLKGEKQYYDITKSTLKEMLLHIGLLKTEIKFLKIKRANLLGTALAAIS